MNYKEQFEEKTIASVIIDTLKNGFDGYVCDLHNEVFNTDYYIIGTFEAKQSLEAFGAFEALNKVISYERDNFGEVNTDLEDFEKVSNMLAYIIGEEVINGLETVRDNWDEMMTEEIAQDIINEINDNY